MLAEKAGTAHEQIVHRNGGTLADLRQMLLHLHPGLNGVEFRMALNRNLGHEAARWAPGDEVALLPPFAGG
jgi:molybdopterin converting factor small subunit